MPGKSWGDVMSKRILIVGCGQLGSRHLQALAQLKNIGTIDIVDPSKEGLALGQQRLGEVQERNPQVHCRWFERLAQAGLGGDLCIVATQAKGRAMLIQQIAQQLQYKNFLVEKIVTQTVGEYERLLQLAQQGGLSVWVNCKTRAYRIHQYIQSKLTPGQRLTFTRTAGNHGLASNGIHAADLFCFYTSASAMNLVGARIDPQLHSSKRGSEVFDLSGGLYATSDRGDDFTVSFHQDHDGPDTITVTDANSRFIVDHQQKTMFESLRQDQWRWRMVPLQEQYEVSHMTKVFAADILGQGHCALPTLQQCYPAHAFILTALGPYFNKFLDRADFLSPVT